MEYQLIETKFGNFLVKPGDLISDELIKGNFWESALLPIFDKYVNKDSTVVEVGSYFGDHTVYLSKLCKRVYAYEGFTRNFLHLSANLLINDCFNVIPVNLIIGNGGYVREARQDCGDDWYPDFSTNAAGARFVAGLSKQTTKLDDLNISKVDFLKVDAEGMDLDVMRGGFYLINKYRPVIVFEYNELIAEPFSEYSNFMSALHYTYTKVDWYNYLALPKEKNYE